MCQYLKTKKEEKCKCLLKWGMNALVGSPPQIFLATNIHFLFHSQGSVQFRHQLWAAMWTHGWLFPSVRMNSCVKSITQSYQAWIIMHSFCLCEVHCLEFLRMIPISNRHVAALRFPVNFAIKQLRHRRWLPLAMDNKKTHTAANVGEQIVASLQNLYFLWNVNGAQCLQGLSDLPWCYFIFFMTNCWGSSSSWLSNPKQRCVYGTVVSSMLLVISGKAWPYM